MSTKFLNLDELAPAVAVTVKLDGTDHQLKEMNVEDFAWVQSKMKTLEKGGESGEYLTALCEMINRSFPTISVERMRSLSLNKLEKLLEFTLNLATQGAEVKVEEGAAATAEDPPVAGS